jgi:polysaccharide export outer membrane protein
MFAKYTFRGILISAVVFIGLGSMGCITPFNPFCRIPRTEAPNEVFKTMLPPYVIEPPDILQISAMQLVPRPPYLIRSLDIFRIQFPSSPDTLKKEDVDDLVRTGRLLVGNFSVEPEGTFDLGPVYGKVSVVGLTIEKARETIEAKLKEVTKKEIVEAGKVTVGLIQSRGMQMILGNHLVRPDGTVGLGTYGSVVVAGLTIPEAKTTIEAHLSRYVQKPEIAVEVGGFNSKVYYLILDQAGYGETVVRIPATGNETVLDALAQVYGLNVTSARRRIWIARPGYTTDTGDMILPVDWNAIVRGGSAKANYQIFPGDRVYIQSQPIITLDTYVARYLEPLQKIMGATLLGTGTYNSLKFVGKQSGLGGGAGAVGR